MKSGRPSTGLPKVFVDSDETFGPNLFLGDSGSDPNLISKDRLRPGVEIFPVKANVKTITGSRLKIVGKCYLTLKKDNSTLGRTMFLVVDEDMPGFDGVLGNDFFKKNKAKLDYQMNAIVLRWRTLPFVTQTRQNSYITAATVEKEKIPIQRMYWMGTEGMKHRKCFLAKVSMTLPPLHMANVPVKCNGVSKGEIEDFYCCERVGPGTDGMLVGRALVKVAEAVVPVINTGLRPLLIKRGQVVTWGSPLSEDEKFFIKSEDKRRMDVMQKFLEKRGRRAFSTERFCNRLMSERRQKEKISKKPQNEVPAQRGREKSNLNSGPHGRSVAQNPKAFLRSRSIPRSGEVLPPLDPKARKELMANIEEAMKKSECPSHLQGVFKQMLLHYHDVIGQATEQLGYCPVYEPSIPLDTENIIYTPQYPVPQRMRSEMDKAVQEFLDAGIIQLSNSPFNSPTIMVPKKDGGYRLVVDYRKLNKHVVTDPHPLPRIAQILEELGGAKYFTAIDLLHGFYNLKIHPNERYKTAFSTPKGHYEFIRLPMGLKNSPAIFQRVMNLVLAGCLGKYAFIYIDDVVIYSKTAEEHIKHVEDVLQRLREAGLRIKFSKSQLFRTSIDYLGYVVSKSGIQVNPVKVEAIKHFPTPYNVKGIQAFLGMVGYFRHFIVDFATIARPLYHLLRKDVKFEWSDRCQKSFNQLKTMMMQAPVLAFPNFAEPFILTTDASGYAVGAALTQKHGKREVLIACASRTLRASEKNYNNTDREILAVRYGIQQFRSYLWGHPFVIRTDNKAIIHIARNTTTDNQRALRWHLDFCEYDYTIEHHQG